MKRWVPILIVLALVFSLLPPYRFAKAGTISINGPTSVTVNNSYSYSASYSGTYQGSLSFLWSPGNYGSVTYQNDSGTSSSTTIQWTQTGTTTLSVTAYDDIGYVGSNYITVSISSSASPLTITTSPSNGSTINTSTNTTLYFSVTASGGTGSYSYSWSSNGLIWSNGGLAEYKWSSPTSTTVSCTVTSGSQTAYASWTVKVSAPPLTATLNVSSTSVYTGDTVYCSVSASGGVGNYSYSWSIGDGYYTYGNSSSSYIGVAWSTVGTKTVSVTVTDSGGHSTTASANVQVNYRPLSVTIYAPSGTLYVGTSYLFTASASGGSGIYTYSWYAQNGSISGSGSGVYISFSSSGSKTVTCAVTDSAGHTASSSVTVSVTYAPLTIINTSPLNSGKVGTYYSVTFTASGGSGQGYSWSLYSGTLPPGLSLSSSGVLSGTPQQQAGGNTYNFTVKVQDNAGNSTTKQFLLAINYADLTITTASLANGAVNSSYSQTLQATGGDGTYTWSVASGSLPNGLSLSSTGVISGTPLKAGSYTFTIQVKDNHNNAAVKSYTISISNSLYITTTTLPDATNGVSYSQTLQATGNVGSITWSYSGSLPNGLSLNNSTGVISGTPNANVGTYSFTVQATDSQGNTATQQLSIKVSNPSLSITTTTLPDATKGVYYSQTLQATGGTGTGYTWSVVSGSLPDGLTLSSSSGVISGTPTSFNTYTFTVQVRDSGNNTATKQLSINVKPAPLSITTTSLPETSKGASYSQTLQATGGTETGYTWSITSGALPKGLNLDASTGTISGTVDTTIDATTYSFTVQVKDSGNNTATKQLSIKVNNAGTITLTADPSSTVDNPLWAGTQVTLTWSSTGVSTINLYSSTDNSNWTLIQSSNNVSGSYTVSPTVTTYYKVQDANNSSVFATVTVWVVNSNSYIVSMNLNPTSGTPGSNASITVSGNVTQNDQPYTGGLSFSLDASSLGWSNSISFSKSTGTSNYSYTLPSATLPTKEGTYTLYLYIVNPTNGNKTLVNQANFVVASNKVNTSITLDKTDVTITQGGSITISGTLKDANNTPVQNANFTLSLSPNDNTISTTSDVTDSTGKFTVTITTTSSTPTGNYTLTVTYQGSSSYNSSSATVTIHVQQAGQLDHLTSDPTSPISIPSTGNQRITIHAYDSNNNEITSLCTFTFSLDQSKGTLYTYQTNYADYYADPTLNSYTVTLTATATYNGVSKSTSITINVSSNTIIVNILDPPTGVMQGSTTTFTAQVLYNNADVTSNSTINWTVKTTDSRITDLGSPTSGAGSTFTWTAPTNVVDNEQLTIEASASYTVNGTTMYNKTSVTVNIVQLAQKTLTITGEYPSYLTGTLTYPDPSTLKPIIISVQGGNSYNFWTSEAYPATLNLNLPFGVDQDYIQSSPLSSVNYLYKADPSTSKSTITIGNSPKQPLTSSSYTLTDDTTVYIVCFTKLSIQTTSIAKKTDSSGTSTIIEVTSTPKAEGSVYGTAPYNTVKYTQVALNIYGTTATYSYAFDTSEVSLNGGTGTWSANIDNLALPDGTYSVYAIATANIKDWSNNGDQVHVYPNPPITITINHGGWYVSAPNPYQVAPKGTVKVYIEKKGSGNQTPRPKAEIRDSNNKIIANLSTFSGAYDSTYDSIQWWAEWTTPNITQDAIYNFYVYDDKDNLIGIREFKVTNNAIPPFSITIYGNVVSVTDPVLQQDGSYVFTTKVSTKVVTWYTSDGKLPNNSNIQITASVTTKDGTTLGTYQGSGVAYTKEVYSSGFVSLDQIPPNDFQFFCTLPKTIVTSNGTTQEVKNYSLLGFTGNTIRFLAQTASGSTITISITETTTATRIDADTINQKYFNQVPTADSASWTGSVSIPTNPSLDVYKTIQNPDGTTSPLGGITFTVIDASGATYTATTDSAGHAYFSSLAPGTAKVIETVPTGYYTDQPTQYVTIQSGSVATVTFANTFAGCTINIHKFTDFNNNRTEDPGEATSGVQFNITGPENYTVTTDSNGNASVVVKKDGVYTITEVPPSNSTPADNPQTVTVSTQDLAGGSHSLVFMNITQKGTIIIRKFGDLNKNGIYDAGEPLLAGASFTISSLSNSYSGTTDSNGMLTLDVIPNTYTITETTPPAGYSGNFTQTVTVNSGQTINIDVPNTTGSARIGIFKFVDSNANGVWDANSETGLGGVVFTVTGPNNFSATATTNANGWAYVDVSAAGTYTVTESIPAGYSNNNPTQTVNITDSDLVSNKEYDLYFANVPTSATIDILKFVDTNGDGIYQSTTEYVQSNIVFTIAGPNGFNAVVQTNASGHAFVSNITVPGTYTITEQTPSGYTAETPTQSINITQNDISSRNTLLAIFGNKPSYLITIFKYLDINGNGVQDSGEPALGNVGFTLLDDTGGGLGDAITNSAGYAYFEVPLSGTYTVEEWPSNAYIAETPRQTVNINAPGNYRLIFANKPLGAQIWIYKYIDTNGNGIRDSNEPSQDGVTFTITDPTGATTSVVTYNGLAEYTANIAGTYTIKENTPAGYVAETPTQTVNVTQNDINTGKIYNLTFANKPASASIIIYKFVDLNGNGIQDTGESSQANVIFTITGPNGFNATVVTNSTGFTNTIFITTAGTYTITEQVPSGYTAETPTQTINVTSTDLTNSKTFNLVFANKPSQTVAKITITKIKDLNGNGITDPLDTVMPNVTFTVTGPNGFNKTVVTNSNGVAVIDNISVPGTYTVREQTPSGYIAESLSQSVNITTTDISSNRNFSLTFYNKPQTYCWNNWDVSPPYVIAYTKADPNYNEITITVFIGKIDDPTAFPGASSAFLTIPQQQGMQSGLYNVPMNPVSSSKDSYGLYHQFTYTWFDVEDPKVVPDGTIRTGRITFTNSVFGSNAPNCPVDIQWTVKNPTYHLSSFDNFIQKVSNRISLFFNWIRVALRRMFEILAYNA